MDYSDTDTDSDMEIIEDKLWHEEEEVVVDSKFPPAAKDDDDDSSWDGDWKVRRRPTPSKTRLRTRYHSRPMVMMRSNRQIEIDVGTLTKYFHLPITMASTKLSVCTTVLKKICRLYGIVRWPYRKINSFNKEIQLMKNVVDQTKGRKREEWSDRLEGAEVARNEFMNNIITGPQQQQRSQCIKQRRLRSITMEEGAKYT